MKKLMIAAAAAALSSGAFAGICGDEDPVVDVVAGREVYKVAFTGKTTIGVPGKDVVTPVFCSEDQKEDGCVIRVPGTLKIEGWVLLCDVACNAKIEAFAAPAYWAFWASKPYTADIPEGKLEFSVLNVIGKKGADAEAAGKFTGKVVYGPGFEWDLAEGLEYAGLGKYSAKNGTFTSFTGNFAGAPAGSWYIKGKVCEQTHVYDCTTMLVDCENVPNTVAFGKWTMKYDASASKAAYKGKMPKTPKYATINAG